MTRYQEHNTAVTLNIIGKVMMLYCWNQEAHVVQDLVVGLAQQEHSPEMQPVACSEHFWGSFCSFFYVAVFGSFSISVDIVVLFSICRHFFLCLFFPLLFPSFEGLEILRGKATVGKHPAWWQRYEWKWRHLLRSLRKWLQQCCKSFCVIHEYSDGSSTLELSEQTIILSTESHCNLWVSIVE